MKPRYWFKKLDAFVAKGRRCWYCGRPGKEGSDGEVMCNACWKRT